MLWACRRAHWSYDLHAGALAPPYRARITQYAPCLVLGMPSAVL